MGCFRLSKTHSEVVEINRWFKKQYFGGLGMSSVSSPFLSLIFSCNLTLPEFVGLKSGLRRLRRPKRSAWFSGDNGLIDVNRVIGLIGDGDGRSIIDVRDRSDVGGWSLHYVRVKQWYLLPHTR